MALCTTCLICPCPFPVGLPTLFFHLGNRGGGGGLNMGGISLSQVFPQNIYHQPPSLLTFRSLCCIGLLVRHVVLSGWGGGGRLIAHLLHPPHYHQSGNSFHITLLYCWKNHQSHSFFIPYKCLGQHPTLPHLRWGRADLAPFLGQY